MCTRKLQGHWIIEMSEMIAQPTPRVLRNHKSFLSRQKETYKVPYETHPADAAAAMCIWRDDQPAGLFAPVTAPATGAFSP